MPRVNNCFLGRRLRGGVRKAWAARHSLCQRRDQTIEAWCPKAIAQIRSEKKALPATLQDRSIEIRLRKKLRAEKITRFRADRVQHLKNIRRRVARWTADNLELLRARDAHVPQKIANDRAADNWRTLLNIADVIGGKWP